MSFKKPVLILALLVVMLSWAAGHIFASPVLIKLELKDESEYENARALNVRAFHRIGDLFIAEFEESDLRALQDAGLTHQIVDREPWSETYYLISESKKFERVNFSQYGRVLVDTENSYFMKISDEGARSLAAKGYYIVKVFPHAIPLKYKPAPEGVLKSSAADPSIDSLLSLISEDSLYTWTLRLQDFQTRYSYTDSIHTARQWIFDKFVSFGIDSVWFHHPGFPI